jgi:P-type E1-E2 ATPase
LAKAIWAISSIIGAIPILIDLIHEIRAGEFGVDVIAITTIVAALLMGEYLVAIVILLMVNSGEALEEYAQSRAKHELSALLAAAPVLAHLQRGSGYADIPVAEIQPGDIIEIRPGELVPVDCTLMEGDSSFDEAALTGESLPVDKTIGDDLLSGSVNTTGLIVAKARHTSGDSQYEHIISLVQTASSSRSPMVRLADQYSLPFTIVSFGLAGLAWIISGQPVRALEVLVVATPCPLLL